MLSPPESVSLPAADARIAAVLAVAALAQACPRALIDRTLADSEAAGQRQRALPPWAVAYCVMGFALWPQAPSEAVLRAIGEGLRALSATPMPALQAGKSALSQARQRLGAQGMQALARQVLQPLAPVGQPGAWLAGRRVLCLRRRLLALPDTPANRQHFALATPGAEAGPLGALVLVLAEGATNAPVAAAVADCTQPLAAQCLSFLAQQRPPGTVLLLEPGPDDEAVLDAALAGTEPVVGVIAAATRPPIERVLSDGSYAGRDAAGRWLRIVGYTLQADGVRPHDARFLVTNLLDAALAPALDLVAVAEASLRTAGLAPTGLAPTFSAPLRSKSPGLVLQEIWGLLIAEYALCRLGSLAVLPPPMPAEAASRSPSAN